MKYFVSLPPLQRQNNEGARDWAPAGEAVIPDFPAPPKNRFLSLVSFKPAPYAVVLDVTFDPDVMAGILKKEYPGLPPDLHDNYILRMCQAAAELPIGTRVRVIVSEEQATLQVVDTDKTIVLWTEQPLKKKM